MPEDVRVGKRTKIMFFQNDIYGKCCRCEWMSVRKEFFYITQSFRDHYIRGTKCEGEKFPHSKAKGLSNRAKQYLQKYRLVIY